MKSSMPLLLAAFSFTSIQGAAAQGTFIYDQQSSVDGSYLEGALADIQGAQPFGQSFTPSLSSVNFIRLYIYDSTAGGGGPGTLSVNLRTGSITGAILGTADPVILEPGFSGLVNFHFASPVSLTPQDTYYFQPFVQAGGRWGTFEDRYNYSGGTAFGLGVPSSNFDLWFREGIFVPEPSSAALLALGGGIFVLLRHRIVLGRPTPPST